MKTLIWLEAIKYRKKGGGGRERKENNIPNKNKT